MGRTKKVGPTRGLGSRYGATVRKRYMKVITEMRKPHKCPNCGFMKVSRLGVGIWQCGKCGYTYTGGAYIPATKLGIVAKRSAKGPTPEQTMKVVESAQKAEPAEEEDETR